jgi:hypothetical protein
MGFCVLTDVTARVPRFTVDLPNNPSTEQIGQWIDNRAGEIYARLLNRGIDPGWNASKLSSMGLTADQVAAATAWLREANIKGALADVLNSLQSSITLQAGEVSEASRAMREYQQLLMEIARGFYDALFGNASRLQGYAGGDTLVGATPSGLGLNVAFGKANNY